MSKVQNSSIELQGIPFPYGVRELGASVEVLKFEEYHGFRSQLMDAEKPVPERGGKMGNHFEVEDEGGESLPCTILPPGAAFQA